MQISKLTDNGTAAQRGDFAGWPLRCIRQRREQQSLWVIQIATGARPKWSPPGPGYFMWRPTFSPDGNYIYYDHSDPQNDNELLLYSVPAWAARRRRVLADISTPVSFSPDGNKLSSDIRDPGEKNGPTRDGRQRRREPSYHCRAPRFLRFAGVALSWSGDGKLIAAPSTISPKASWVRFRFFPQKDRW